MHSWQTFEEKVRSVAQFIWGPPCEPARVGGVNLDGVVRLSQEIVHFVEITEDATLGKVRTDVGKLHVARAAAFADNVLARCFCVINGNVTPAMKDAGAAQKIKVLIFNQFSKMFFDFEAYRHARIRHPFGSSVNPLTGEIDKAAYVPVRYTLEQNGASITADDICNILRSGKNIVLLGEYGSGKSRCIRQVFDILSEATKEDFLYPIAMDLRKSWGLDDGGELVRRHMRDMASDALAVPALRAAATGSLAFLIDGFDEIGAQAWNNDGQRLRELRAIALAGVKSLASEAKGCVLVAGREHYFQSVDEMLSALGLNQKNTQIVRCNNEFTDSEMLEYFENRNIQVDLPQWLPRRPLICQTIADLDDEEFDLILGESGDEVAFWDHFIQVLCARDARIHATFNAQIIYQLFIHLARLTRTKPANVGPISPAEMEEAFELVVGKRPVEEASAMLLRLPSLGRISVDSNDRQFVDTYILDGLRAKDVSLVAVAQEAEVAKVCATPWVNPLGELGQRVLRRTPAGLLALGRRASLSINAVLASDIAATLARGPGGLVDFEGMKVDQGKFDHLDLNDRAVRNITISNSYIAEFIPPRKELQNVLVVDCIAHKVSGISSARALGQNVSNLDADNFDSVESVSKIRKIGLTPAQTILTTIVRKTFFQPGGGRKEEALLRGLGKIASEKQTEKILKGLIAEGLLQKVRGKEGWLYIPVRGHTARMQAMLDQLTSSQDPIWLALEN